MSNTVDQPRTHLEAIRADLTELADDARWAQVHGYWRAGRGLDAVRGQSLRPPSTSELIARAAGDLDHKAGSLYDLEVGDHRTRVAYQSVIDVVSLAEFTLAFLLLDAGVRRQPEVIVLDRFADAHEIVVAAERAKWRCDRLDETSVQRRPLVHLRTELDRAVRAMRAALDVGPVVIGPQRPCKTCQIREQATRRTKAGKTRAHRGGECNVCAQYRIRHRRPRPTDLDHDMVHGPRAAQRRRQARGEGWGAA